jgi:2-C-methyl-D-erythritol 4-phosphate cytidylyltransferase
MRRGVVIPAAGVGKRLGGETPKQFVEVGGETILARAVGVFERNDRIDEIVAVVSRSRVEETQTTLRRGGFRKVVAVVEGGSERHESVRNGVAALSLADDDLVAVHDAARPLLPAETLDRALDAAEETGGAVVALSARDTLMKSADDVISHPDRRDFRYVQTPQIFRRGDLLRAFDRAAVRGESPTDESSMMNAFGAPFALVEGSPLNFKVTSPEDLLLLRALLAYGVTNP